MEARISCNFRTHSYKFRKGKIMGAQGSNLPRNFPKMERLLAPKQPEICQSCAKVALQGKSCAVARKREKKLRSATSQFSGGTNQGRLSPQQPWRSSFHLRSTPPPFRPPANSFWTFYTQFCAILDVFPMNLGSWQSGIMTQKNKKIYINGVAKAHCMLAFFKWRIKRNRASVASEKIFEKMIGRLYKMLK